MYVNDAYILAFSDKEGEVYNVHITDDLDERGTWEYIDFKFTLPHSCYILIWRRDKKKFTKENAKTVTKYVRDDLRDFIDEGKFNGSTWHQKIRQRLVDANNCLVLAWDEMVLPELNESWEEFATESYKIAKEESETIAEPGSLHDQELAIYEGKIDFGRQQYQALKAFGARTNMYTGVKIPSDEIIQRYVTEMVLENYEEANTILSKHYDVFPATVDIDYNEGDVFVGYDFVNHKILFDLSKLPEVSLRIPALLLGFFRHLSCVKDWVFSQDTLESASLEKIEAEKFSHDTIKRMLEIGIDPR